MNKPLKTRAEIESLFAERLAVSEKLRARRLQTIRECAAWNAKYSHDSENIIKAEEVLRNVPPNRAAIILFRRPTLEEIRKAEWKKQQALSKKCD